MKTIDFGAGTRIERAADMLVVAAKQHGTAQGDFNEITLTAGAGTTAESIVAYFDAETKARGEAYRNSPAGKAAAQEGRERQRAAQGKHDDLIARLVGLDWSSDVAILDWLCAMQDPSDRVGVNVSKATILATFSEHGYLPSVNCGEDFLAEDRDNVHRWIVGQALDCLQKVSIHGIIHKFTGEWKSKFIH